MTRRQVLRHAGGAAALAAGALLLRPWPAAGASQGPLTFADVLPRVGSPFDVGAAPGRRMRVTLVEAILHPPRGQGGRVVNGEAFSLIFSGGGDALAAGTYGFRHPALGSFSLFVSPVGQARNGQRHEAVVNRHALAA
jgi:hypothetical protein